jgi:hypothetical protein
MSQPVSGTPRVSGPGSQFSSSRLQAAGQHLRGVQAAGSRQRLHHLRAHRVGRLGQVAHAGAGLLADPLGQRQQAAGGRMLRRGVAQQHGLALARSALATACAASLAVPAAGAETPLAAATAAATSASNWGHCPGSPSDDAASGMAQASASRSSAVSAATCAP